ncbi:hypothetical protein [Halobacillus naozhouensis]|uniref:Uncharacterized protein n=1 Tax=Halobacillus naozhouensis TaxID=554880 RepID=A0ABY8J3E8_9BACI|nr:hypothetical protein [Halobacillus naozhouensis]WFT75923.1 hypothetical protein P9989_05945 [Halobacillus naozhouensis]
MLTVMIARVRNKPVELSIEQAIMTIRGADYKLESQWSVSG